MNYSYPLTAAQPESNKAEVSQTIFGHSLEQKQETDSPCCACFALLLQPHAVLQPVRQAVVCLVRILHTKTVVQEKKLRTLYSSKKLLVSVFIILPS